MPPFGNKEREKMIMQVAEVMLPVVYIGHASNFTHRDDGGYAEYIAAECLRVSEVFVEALEARP